MQGVPVYVGDEQRPLAGWLHSPADGTARAGVLICPPVGREMLFSYAALRQLAIELAARGMLVLRLDYDGTGDSAGSAGDPGRLPAWQRSVRTGLRHLEELGSPTLAVVGLRTGALVAASALDGERTTPPQVASFVLWDPMMSGRVFLRDQRMLVRLLTNAADDQKQDGAVHGHSSVFTPELSESLTRLSGDSLVGPVAQQTLLLHRPDVLHDVQTARRLGVTSVARPVEGQEAMLEQEPPRLPTAAIAAIADHLDETLPRAAVPVAHVEPRSAAVVRDRAGIAVREQYWRSGDGLMHGVLTTPIAPPGDGPPLPTVLLLPSGVGTRIGLGRLWVELARECAARGVPVLRLDLTGLGDSDTRPGQPRGRNYTPESVADVVAAAHDLRPDDPTQVRLVGHCSTAWTVLQAAVELRSVSVHPVNLQPYVDIAHQRALDALLDVEQGVEADGPASPGPSGIPAQRQWRSSFMAFGRRPWVERHRGRVPDWAWTVLQTSGVLPSPVRHISELTDAGTRVHVVTDQLDGAFFVADGRRAVRRLPEGLFGLDVVPVTDHAFASASARRGVAQALLQELCSAPAPVSAPSAR